MIILHSKHSKESRELVTSLANNPDFRIIDWYSGGKDVNEYLARYPGPAVFPAMVDEESGFIANGVTSVDDFALEQFKDEKRATTSRIRERCKMAIEGGIDSAVLGEIYRYPTSSTDQFNLNSSVLAAKMYADAGGPYKFWCMNESGVWSRAEHTAAQIEAVGLTVMGFVRGLQDKYELKLQEIAMAASIEELRAIQW